MIRIVVLSPRLDLGAGILQSFKPVDIQTFIAEAAVEGFDGRVVRRFATTTEVENHLIRVCPEVHGRPDELAAVVTVDPLRQPAIEAEPLERGHHVLAGEPAAPCEVEAPP